MPLRPFGSGLEGQNMKRLILTADASTSFGLKEAGRADIAVPFMTRLVWGPLPSETELAAIVAARTTQEPGFHWLDYRMSRDPQPAGQKDLGLIELCARCDTVELWLETEPNDQLMLMWLLDYLHSHAKATAKRMLLCHVNRNLINDRPDELARWKFPVVDITDDHLELANLVWQAYREPTPQAWFNLSKLDLSIFPMLGRCVMELLEELPGRATGLGATEMRLLELIGGGCSRTNGLFYLSSLRQRRVFRQAEIPFLLEGLAFGPKPAVAGLDEALRGKDYDGREDAYRRSELSLTKFGKSILAHKEDFSRHNPIDRWWGGTRLTNDRLWRWDPVLVAP
jgi:hypothetical protein